MDRSDWKKLTRRTMIFSRTQKITQEYTISFKKMPVPYERPGELKGDYLTSPAFSSGKYHWNKSINKNNMVENFTSSIEKATQMSDLSFLEKFGIPNTPVLLQNYMTGWPAFTKWN